MIDRVEKAIRHAFIKLIERDGALFKCAIEEHAGYDSRKLHEVCINHKLAIYLEEYLSPALTNGGELFFADIEFNREGADFKNLQYDGQERRVRPDIIIHNRKTGYQKRNFLVVECKKDTATDEERAEDVRKIRAFLTDPRYEYMFGLQAIYSSDGVSGCLFFKANGQVSSREIT